MIKGDPATANSGMVRGRTEVEFFGELTLETRAILKFGTHIMQTVRFCFNAEEAAPLSKASEGAHSLLTP